MFQKITFLISLLFFIGLGPNAMSQIKTPAPSPAASVTQTIGLVEVQVDYSRPSVKGRTIFSADGLVPFDQLWRTGANAATKLTCNDEIMVGGQLLKKGSYAILSKPGSTSWEFYFHTYEKGSWSSYKEKEPVAKVSVPSFSSMKSTESFAISFNDLKASSANLTMMWDKTMVNIPIAVKTDERVMANIERVMSGPSKGEYYSAANYYFESGKDLNKAYEFISKATEGSDKKFWQVRKKSQIEAALGKYKQAIKTATSAMGLAEKAGNMQYVKYNKEAIAEWSKK